MKRNLHFREATSSYIATNASRSFAYSIPAEVAKAARIVAESEPLSPSIANFTISSAPLPGTNDTNAMS